VMPRKTSLPSPYPAQAAGPFPFIRGRNHQAAFFDAPTKFIEKKACIRCGKVAIPQGAKHVKLEFNQPEVSPETNHPGAGHPGHCGRITNFRPPQDVYFNHNLLSRNRGLGMAFTGGAQRVIEDNRFGKNGGQAPGFGIDFESGRELMQNVVFYRNTFRGDAGNLVVCARTELLFGQVTGAGLSRKKEAAKVARRE